MDVLAQAVELVGKAGGDFEAVDGGFDLFEAQEGMAAGFGGGCSYAAAFEGQERAIPPVKAQFDAPLVDGRDEAHGGDQYDDGGNESEKNAPDDAGQPKRQRIIEEPLARFVKTGSVRADGKVMLERRGEFATPFEQARRAVDLLCRLQQ